IRRSRGVGRVDAVLVGYLGHLDVHLARWLFRGTPVVLDHMVFLADTAHDRGLGAGWKRQLLSFIDRRAVAAADLVLLDTHEHAELMAKPWRDRAVVVPVGAPNSWFQAPAVDRDPTGRVVFFGLYTPLQGAPLIGDAIRLLAGERISFTMLGHGQDLAETRRRAGDHGQVEWIEWVEPGELPALVAQHDVCLGIFGTGPKARRVVPNKVYQGLAAGCAIVTSDTPPQRRVLGGVGVLVPPGDAIALADAISSLIAHPEELRHRQRLSFELADREYRPHAVVQPVLDRLGLRATDTTDP
ncbi:MAG: glycosyltransferase, partial [Nitriliruptorales bacterium]|nr:glycosyltransferase [Nitriliruptorales bacterium]